MPPVNPYSKYIKQYQTSNITTATPEKLMILLFDGALQFLQKAKSAIAEGNLKERAENIDGARKILRELMRTIDLENGNDVAKSLFKLYNRMTMNLIKANVTRKSELIDIVIEDLTNIRWGFQKAIEIQNGTVTVEEAMRLTEKEYKKMKALASKSTTKTKTTKKSTPDILPDWLDKEISTVQTTAEEEKEMEDILSSLA